MKAELIELAEEFHELEHFYNHQKATWEKLRKAHAAFQLNRLELERDEKAGPALTRMGEILSARSPYGLIKEAEDLIAAVSAANSLLLSARRNEVVGKVDALIARLDRELTAVRANASLRAACVRPLEALREQVRGQESLAHITQAESEAERGYDSAILRIETFVAPSMPATGGGGGRPGDPLTPPTPSAPIRKRRIVTPAENHDDALPRNARRRERLPGRLCGRSLRRPWRTTNASKSGNQTMNRSDLKDYAPQARRDFIQAMKDRAAFYGLTASKVDPVVERGDAVVIAGREHPRAVGRKRKLLEERVRRNGFDQTMEAMAYTWFNRLVAIRFMELHGYLDHGYRVLSHPDGKPTPELLEHADAEQVSMPGLKRDRIIDLKQAGNKDSELYRLLLTAQCNALHAAMPFLFERIDDETELLLPDNLLHSDSLIRKLVNEIDEKDWKEVEIIGWLYQFYIAEKHDKVIGEVVASEDIPAATQLFTPNWIVKYLVQNTLGRQWLATYPTLCVAAKDGILHRARRADAAKCRISFGRSRRPA